MRKTMPSFFISHGLPPVALQEGEYNNFLKNIGRTFHSGLRGIVCVSSHWMTPGPLQVTSLPRPSVQHNFYGYQKDLYEMSYDPPSSVGLAEEVALALDERFEVTLNEEYGYDHGVWMPLRMMRPEADVPVVQVSLPMFIEPRKMMSIGHALAQLRRDGVMLMGSGVAALNPSKVQWYDQGQSTHPKILEFSNWLRDNLRNANVEELINYKQLAPHADFAHPSTATLLPLFFSMGASLAGDRLEVLFEGFQYHSLSLLSVGLIPEEWGAVSVPTYYQ